MDKWSIFIPLILLLIFVAFYKVFNNKEEVDSEENENEK